MTVLLEIDWRRERQIGPAERTPSSPRLRGTGAHLQSVAHDPPSPPALVRAPSVPEERTDPSQSRRAAPRWGGVRVGSARDRPPAHAAGGLRLYGRRRRPGGEPPSVAGGILPRRVRPERPPRRLG